MPTGFPEPLYEPQHLPAKAASVAWACIHVSNNTNGGPIANNFFWYTAAGPLPAGIFAGTFFSDWKTKMSGFYQLLTNVGQNANLLACWLWDGSVYHTYGTSTFFPATAGSGVFVASRYAPLTQLTGTLNGRTFRRRWYFPLWMKDYVDLDGWSLTGLGASRLRALGLRIFFSTFSSQGVSWSPCIRSVKYNVLVPITGFFPPTTLSTYRRWRHKRTPNFYSGTVLNNPTVNG